MIIGGSGSGKTNTLLNLINEQNDIDKIYLYARDLSEPKYEYLIKKREDVGIKHVNNSNAFKYDVWPLWEYWWLQSNQKKKKINCLWWHDCRYYDKLKISCYNQRTVIRCRKLQSLITKILGKFTENAQKNHITFWQ